MIGVGKGLTPERAVGEKKRVAIELYTLTISVQAEWVGL